MNLINSSYKIFVKKKSLNKTIIICYNNEFYSILEALESYKIPINYQCRSGYCGSCRVILNKGNIQYFISPLASSLPKEILTCCCYPINHITLVI